MSDRLPIQDAVDTIDQLLLDAEPGIDLSGYRQTVDAVALVIRQRDEAREGLMHASLGKPHLTAAEALDLVRQYGDGWSGGKEYIAAAVMGYVDGMRAVLQ